MALKETIYKELNNMDLRQRVEAFYHLDDHSLVNYVRFAWKDIEPSVPYIHNWHIDAICEHLEAVTTGQVRKLIINIPPRFAKSTITAVLWPTWVWTKIPSKQWLFSSYGEDLAVRDNLKSRDLIKSPFYQALWGAEFSLNRELEAAIYNDKRGYRYSGSVGGRITGMGGDFVVTDDPHKIEEINSDSAVERVLDWWDQTMNTRLNNPLKSGRVIVMQRLRENDLCGHLLAKNSGYVHLCLPMEYEGKKYSTPVGWINPKTGKKERYEDPRVEVGELLFEKRFPKQVVDELKEELLEYGYASKYQQNPVPKGGAMFSRAWFKAVDFSPIDIKKCIRYWDKAGSYGTGAYTVGVRMVITHDNRVFVEDVVRQQLDDLGREQLIRNVAETDRMIRPQTEVWLEQEPGSGGKDSAAATVRNLAGFRVYTERATGDKVTRAHPLAAYVKAGNVLLVKAEWNEGYMREFEYFPKGKYKDQVDASTGAFNKLFRGGFAYNLEEGV
jgi:predicted phage terminase large subunit-like protein